MAKNTNSKFLVLTLGVGFLMMAGSGCSHHHSKRASSSNDSASATPPDAGTDAVPSAAVEESSGSGTPTAISEETPPPPAADVNAAAVPPAPSGESEPAPMVAAADPNSGPAPADNTPSGSYTVRHGQTLMMIAFENYGDLYKWKEIYEANKDRISNPNAIPAGTVLRMDTSAVPVAVDKNGDQYLIKQGDTLGTISTDVYGTTKKWKKLWENNKQIIKNPNRIYAGFYLYYTLTPEEREQYDKRDHTVSPAPLAKKAIKGPSPASVSPVVMAPPSMDVPPAPAPAATNDFQAAAKKARAALGNNQTGDLNQLSK